MGCAVNAVRRHFDVSGVSAITDLTQQREQRLGATKAVIKIVRGRSCIRKMHAKCLIRQQFGDNNHW
jgi:hypothetical protein